MDEQQKGIVVQLPPSVAEELRNSNNNCETKKRSPEWNDVIVAPPTEAEEEKEEEEAIVEQQASDDLSYGAPPCLPQLLIDWERLVGYYPTTETERTALITQVQIAMFGRLLIDDNDGASSDDNDESSFDWDSRVQKLLETNVAWHVDTKKRLSSTLSAGRYGRINYPEYLYRRRQDPEQQEQSSLISTARLWKRLLSRWTPPNAAVNESACCVNRILLHLQDCHRSLLWKHDMHCEIIRLAQQEEASRRARAQKRVVAQWKQQRSAKLEELYTVRETVMHSLKMSEHRLDALTKQRDAAVKEELAKFDDADLQESAFAFAEEGQLQEDIKSLFGIKDEEDTNYTQVDPYRALNDDVHDESSIDDGEEGNDEGVVNNPPKKLNDTITAPRGAFGEASDEQWLNDTVSQEYVTRATAAKALEKRIEEQCTTPDLLKATAAVKAMTDRLQGVDDLLESMQDEEWADEEEAGTRGKPCHTDVDQSDEQLDDTSSFSLLDQILAMILGASRPPCTQQDDRSHIQFLEFEHLEIKEQWKDYFGRLPPSHEAPTQREQKVVLPDSLKATLKISLTGQEARDALGIVDNDDDSDWDWPDESEEEEEESFIEKAPEKVVVGLRPGGRSTI